MRRALVFLLTLPFLAAAECGELPGGGDDGAGSATVTITRDGQDETLTHDPSLSDLSLTPPAQGVVELTFAYQDPAITVRLRVDGGAVSTGDTVTLPSPDVELVVETDTGTFSSANDGSSGQVTFDQLDVTEDAASLAASFDATLADDEGATIAVVGDVDAET
jgi:hypothetical protein